MEQLKGHLLNIVNKYNYLMKEAIQGPNCIDPHICHADCCHIKIDIPKLLAEYYIENGHAEKEDFSRGDLFSFKINVNSSNSKCFFYNKDLNGCSLHKTMHKPPQCWIYPTGFSNDPSEEKTFAVDGTIKCKIAAGWRITDIKKTKEANALFVEYVTLCKREFAIETTIEKIKDRLEPLFKSLENCSPKSIAGVVDEWDQFTILKSEGVSLKLKSLCDQICEFPSECEYMECEKVCSKIIEVLRRFLLNDISNFVQKNGPKSSYSFMELWNSK